MAKKVEELELWRKATEFWKAVDPLLTRSAFERDWKLRNQLRDAIDSILSNISEGFEQSSDRGFAKYLYDAKGSTAEARRRLWMAAERKYIPTETFKELDNAGDQVARMTVGLIKYLIKSSRRDRGLGSPDVSGPAENEKAPSPKRISRTHPD